MISPDNWCLSSVPEKKKRQNILRVTRPRQLAEMRVVFMNRQRVREALIISELQSGDDINM